MREKAKELQRQRMEAAKKGMKSPGFGGGGFGRDTGYTSAPTVGDTANLPEELSKLGFIAVQKPVILTKAMKLGSKARDVESFVDQLKSEGEKVVVPVSNKTVLPINKLPENVHDLPSFLIPLLWVRVWSDLPTHPLAMRTASTRLVHRVTWLIDSGPCASAVHEPLARGWTNLLPLEEPFPAPERTVYLRGVFWLTNLTVHLRGRGEEVFKSGLIVYLDQS
uniref:Uncharacterized protein n=1 Tax=Timema cristinae TaxID=61476 RepID=A0A7R9HGJ4_TIMCR|nr:unnamed protein product [Timema cristinae]